MARMSNMESLDKIDFKKADPKKMISHIEEFPQLCEKAFEFIDDLTIPSYYIKAKKIVIVGMGSSGQAGDIIKNLMFSHHEVIVESLHNYELPGYVDKDTIVIACSNSGNTEEVLAAFIEAYEKGAKLIAITRGGKLQILASKYSAPICSFGYNSPPRAAFPYIFVYLLGIFWKLGYLELDRDLITNLSTLLSELKNKYCYENSLFSNPAKIMAQKLYDKIPVIYASEKLSGVAARVKAQFNENSKNFSFFEEIPELNHKSIEGLANPKNSNIFVIMLESNWEQLRNIKRQNITSEVLSKAKIGLERIKLLQAKDQISEILALVMFFEFISYYLAILNRVNPSSNDTVNYLKDRLV